MAKENLPLVNLVKCQNDFYSGQLGAHVTSVQTD